MATIDRLPDDAYKHFANQTKATEDFKHQYNISAKGIAATDSLVSNSVEVLTQKAEGEAILALVGADQRKGWSHIAPPPNYNAYYFLPIITSQKATTLKGQVDAVVQETQASTLPSDQGKRETDQIAKEGQQLNEVFEHAGLRAKDLDYVLAKRASLLQG